MTSIRRWAWASCGALLALASVAFAQAVPSPAWVRSVVPRVEQLAVYDQPDDGAHRRGTVLAGARLPALGRTFGQGCGGAFVQIGADAFVCERDVTQSREAPASAAATSGGSARARREDALPHEYLQVAADGTRGYASPADYATDEYATAFGPGFSLAVAGRIEHEGVAFVRTRGGHYVLERDLRPMRASGFEGVKLESRDLARLGWVVQEGAAINDTHTGRMLRRAKRLERVDVRGQRAGVLELGGGGLTGLSDGGVVDARAVRRPELRSPPPGVKSNERWIDIDLSRQILVAYAGATPVFATLISSGREGGATRTPRGAFRIWVKLRSSDMRDHEAYELERSYAIEQVPWVQYFSQGYGLHAAFWHERFGEPHSRGCINLSPRDARFMFEFTSPALPPGWFAIRPVASDPSTLVVVR